MSSTTAPEERRRTELAADAFLLAVASFSVLTGLALALKAAGLVPALGDAPPTLLGVALSAGVGLLSFGGVLIGPVIAWRLHGGRPGGPAVIGGLFGLVAGSVAVVLIGLVAAGIATGVTALGGSDIAGAIGVLAIVAVAVLALAAWVDADAVRDLAPKRREHVRIDIARLGATAAIVVFAVGITLAQTADPEGGVAEAGVFAVAAGVLGAFEAAGADGLTTYASRQNPTDPVIGP
jgi:hypothetical protein